MQDYMYKNINNNNTNNITIMSEWEVLILPLPCTNTVGSSP